MSLAALNGAVVTRARVQVPAWGRWWADVDVQSALDLDAGATATLVLADVTLTGAVVTGGTAHGRAAYRIVGGAGGWSTDVVSRGYRDQLGVQVAAVVSDVASLVGESLGTLPMTRRGSHYVREAGPASRVLNALFPQSWYVDFAGVTQLSLRADTEYDGSATRTRVAPGSDVIEIATTEIATLVPGVVVDGAQPATDVEYRLDEGRLTVVVFSGTAPSRDLAAFASLLDALDPHRRFRGASEFRVVTQSGEKLNLQPVRASAGLADLEQVPVRLAPGVRASHLLGSLVTVVFLDGDSSRPRVISGDDAGAPGWMPLFLNLGEDPVLGVARQTDTVVAGGFAGTVTGGSVRVKAGL